MIEYNFETFKFRIKLKNLFFFLYIFDREMIEYNFKTRRIKNS